MSALPMAAATPALQAQGLRVTLGAREVLHLGRGEAGFAGPGGDTARPFTIPKFIDFDRIPLPTSRNPMLASILGESGIRSSNVCK